MLIKMYCLGIHGYFASLFNRFDCLVSVADYMQHVVVVGMGGVGGGEVKSSPLENRELRKPQRNLCTQPPSLSKNRPFSDFYHNFLTTTVTAAKLSLENWIRAPPNFITLILINSILQVLGKFSGVDSKGLFTWRWGTPGRRGNPLRCGNPSVHIISHFNLITFT